MPTPTLQQKLAARKMWRPKLPEVSVQCASCPLREGNDKEFGEVLSRLRASQGFDSRITPELVAYARYKVKEDLEYQGDFICHGTAYNPDMTLKETSERRQCKGAAEYYRNGKAFCGR